MSKRNDFRDPPSWMLFLGVTLILGALVLLMFIPENSWGF